MEKRLSAWDTRRQFGKVLREVSRDGDFFVIESHGEPVAVLAPIEMYQGWKRSRQAFFDHLRTVSERANLTDEETQETLDRAIQAVREEHGRRAHR